MRRLIFGFLAVLGALSPIGQLRAESPTNLNELFVHQWVQATDKGEIVGTVTEPQANDAQKLEKVKIAIVQDGKILHVGESDASGKFAISGVKPGSYSLIARGEKTLAAFSLQVLGPEAGKHLTNEVDVRCIRPAGEKVIDIVRSQIVPPYLTRFDAAANTMVDPLGDSRKFAETHLVVADENGAMMGQLGKAMLSKVDDLSDMMVYVTQDGVEVARTAVEKDGSFKINGLKSGSYGLVAAGADGFAALSFQFENKGLAKSESEKGEFLVGRRHGCRKMNVEVIQCCDVKCCEQPIVCETPVVTETVACNPPVSEVVVDPVQPAPAYGMGGWGGGFYGGGGGFGGGGGGGFGGMGGALIGAAGLAGIAAVIADDDDDFVPVPVVSN